MVILFAYVILIRDRLLSFQKYKKQKLSMIVFPALHLSIKRTILKSRVERARRPKIGCTA
jgi:hypothetical protein